MRIFKVLVRFVAGDCAVRRYPGIAAKRRRGTRILGCISFISEKPMECSSARLEEDLELAFWIFCCGCLASGVRLVVFGVRSVEAKDVQRCKRRQP